MRNCIFIAGCARSGTTLLLQLMASFKETYALTELEKHFTDFPKLNVAAPNLVLKRHWESYLDLADIDPEIHLVYAVRHPFDTLTSYHPAFPDRRFYVSMRRWQGEYDALRELRARQPSRKITYVRYCDLVISPDATQRHIAASLGLKIAYPFSQSGITFATDSIAKYEKDTRLQRYLWLLPYGFRRELKDYCDEFGYELPPGYLRPPSRWGDAVRRIIVPIMARKAIVTLNLSPRKVRILLSQLLRRLNRGGIGAHRPQK